MKTIKTILTFDGNKSLIVKLSFFRPSLCLSTAFFFSCFVNFSICNQETSSAFECKQNDMKERYGNQALLQSDVECYSQGNVYLLATHSDRKRMIFFFLTVNKRELVHSAILRMKLRVYSKYSSFVGSLHSYLTCITHT